jgi:hypothetical protein
MVNWLYFYVIGCLPAMLLVALVAYQRRESHRMGLRSVAHLAISAGVVWPLLALASVQVLGLLMLAKVFDVLRSIGHRTTEPVEHQTLGTVPVEHAAAIVLDPAAAAA